MLELTVQVALLMARCDGRIAQKERAVIDEHLRQRFGYDPALYNRARAMAAHYESAAIDVDACLQRIAATFTVPHRVALLEFASRIAAASRGITKREAALLQKIARRLGVEPPSMRRPQVEAAPIVQASSEPIAARELPTTPMEPGQNTHTVVQKRDLWGGAIYCIEEPAQPTPAVQKNLQEKPKPKGSAREDLLAALEIDSAVPLSADLIRRQFRLLSERYSPEKVASLGADFVAMATQKREAATAAARALIAEFGESLEQPTDKPEPAGLRDNPDLDAVFGV